MKKPRKLYSEEFKLGAVRLVEQEGHSISGTARELDISQSALRKWIAKYLEKGASPASKLSQEEELRQLRKENRRLKMEQEILKKATAFFAKEQL